MFHLAERVALPPLHSFVTIRLCLAVASSELDGTYSIYSNSRRQDDENEALLLFCRTHPAAFFSLPPAASFSRRVVSSGVVWCGLRDFMKEYQLDCPYAMDRLVKYGVPATVLHRQVDERDQIGRARQAAETVGFIPCVFVQYIQRCVVPFLQRGCLPSMPQTRCLVAAYVRK